MTLRQALMIATGAGLLIRGLRGAGAICYLRNAHDPERHRWEGRSMGLPGFRCRVCGQVGASLDDFRGHLGEGYVADTRRVFDPAHGGTVTRTSAYEKTSRGVH